MEFKIEFSTDSDSVIDWNLMQLTSIKIAEDVARASGRFENTNSIQVTTPPGFLDKFTHRKMYTRIRPETGEIVHAWESCTIDSDEVTAAWKRAGYPTKWGFPEGD